MLPDVVGELTCQVISIFAITSTGGYILCGLSGNFWRILSNPGFWIRNPFDLVPDQREPDSSDFPSLPTMFFLNIAALL